MNTFPLAPRPATATIKGNMHRGLAILAVAILVALAAAGAFVFSGIYDIAAVKPHTPPVYHLLLQTMRHSIKRHASEIHAPDLLDAARASSGLPLFRMHCVRCHGAPGVAPAAEAFGMYPPPPNLVDVARTWPLAEMYWVIKYGIKMTAMPAWHYRLSDEEIWNIVAFVQRLPDYSPAQYQSLRDEPPPARAATVAHAAKRLTGIEGDAKAGRRAIDKYLCATCHVIPGVTGADKSVGPALGGVARRVYIAGSLPNTPDNMADWLEHPQRLKPGSAMPELGVDSEDARDIAAYLYTLVEPD